MQSTPLLGRPMIAWAVLALAAGAGLVRPAPVAAGDTPCDRIDFDPGPPPPRSEPTASGTVMDAASGLGIPNVLVALRQCLPHGEPVVAAVGATDQSGRYALTAPSSGFYYVEAVMSEHPQHLGALSVPTDITDAVWLGDDVVGLNLSIQWGEWGEGGVLNLSGW